MSDELNTIEESAKAIQETAKLGRALADHAADLARFISGVVRGPMEEATGIVHDHLSYVRARRQMRYIARFHEEFGDRSQRAVPLNLAIPLLRDGMIEENDELQDRWVRLLATASDASSPVEVRRSYVGIMRELDPLDARILETIYEGSFRPEIEIRTACLPDRVDTEPNPRPSDLPPEEVQIAIHNLIRLGCLESTMAWAGSRTISAVYQTRLLFGFVNACRRNQSSAAQQDGMRRPAP